MVDLRGASATCIHASQSACHRTEGSVAGLPALHCRVYQNESNNGQYNEDGNHLTTSFLVRPWPGQSGPRVESLHEEPDRRGKPRSCTQSRTACRSRLPTPSKRIYRNAGDVAAGGIGSCGFRVIIVLLLHLSIISKRSRTASRWLLSTKGLDQPKVFAVREVAGDRASRGARASKG